MIRLENLSKHFQDKSVLESVTYHFPHNAKIALIGANGAGKTTLLRIIAGQESADQGQVIIPQQVRLGFLPQHPNPHPQSTILAECLEGATFLNGLQTKMQHSLESYNSTLDSKYLESHEKHEALFRQHDGYSLASLAKKLLTGLGFNESTMTENPTSLSGGWRMRVEIAKLLIDHPQFLILDEPTNHLDLPSLVWLENYMKNYSGTMIIVSHDRTLLNRLPSHILYLRQGRLDGFPGNFDAFLTRRDEIEQQNQARLDNLRRQREEKERFVERFGAKATKARQAQSRVKMIERIHRMERQIDLESEEKSIQIDLPEPERSAKSVLLIEDGSIGYTHPLTENINLEIERGMKVAVIGSNGLGKSTLLKTIAGMIPPVDGRFALSETVKHAYFAQDQNSVLDETKTVFENFRQQSDLDGQVARKILGALLFSGDDINKNAAVLSGGEKSRLSLAMILAKRANLLLFDEPTNHLDMSSVEALSAALEEFRGTLIFVSHDRSFINNIATHTLVFSVSREPTLFIGNLDDYQAQANKTNFPNVLDDTASSSHLPIVKSKPNETNYQSVKNMQRQHKNLSSKLDKIELQIQQATNLQTTIETKMTITTEFEKLAELQDQLTKVQSQITHFEDEWMNLSQELEKTTKSLKELNRL